MEYNLLNSSITSSKRLRGVFGIKDTLAQDEGKEIGDNVD
jgi:hypothetical protein